MAEKNEQRMKMAVRSATGWIFLLQILFFAATAAADDTNKLFQPCSDTTVQRNDGFTFGLAFAAQEAFLFNRTVALSPCDHRLSLSSSGAKLALFRPKIDEISILTLNTANLPLAVTPGGFMVAFAGRKYAARSPATFIGNAEYTITSFTLVLEFDKGRLQNMLWKRDKCTNCRGNSTASTTVCLKDLGCAVRTPRCKPTGNVDCNLSIQVAFSGTDKNYDALNSWYEVSKLRQYSLYSLYSDLRSSVVNQLGQFF